MKKTVQLFVLMSFCAFISKAGFSQDYAMMTKMLGTNRAAFDNFGYSVSVSGSYAVIGAYQDDKNATGGAVLTDAGAAYVFYRNPAGSWTFQQKLVAADRAANDRFGYSVAISGNYIVIGATYEDEDTYGSSTLNNAGSAYVFYRSGTSTWTQQAKLNQVGRIADDMFGNSVSIDGDYVVVGCQSQDLNVYNQSTGAAYVFFRNGTTWTQQAKLVASDAAKTDLFGCAVDISGNYIVVGAYGEDDESYAMTGNGAAYIFSRTGTTWSQIKKVYSSDHKANDWFGIAVAIKGNYVIVGANNKNETAGTTTYTSTGAAYVFLINYSSVSQQQKLICSDNANYKYFGNAVDIIGNYAVVGAYGDNGSRGAVYAYSRLGTVWTQQQKLVKTGALANDNYGFSVAMDGALMIACAYGEDEGTTYDVGSVFSYQSSVLILPVKLVSFTGKKADEHRNILDWSTATETQGSMFDIERSMDGRNFSKLNTTLGKAGANGNANYSYYDDQPLPGQSYYRIKVVEKDGSFSYSSIVVIKANSFGEVNIVPSVAVSSITITNTDPSLNGKQANILDMQGKTILKIVIEPNLKLDISTLSAGIYTIQLPDGTVKRIVKQ